MATDRIEPRVKAADLMEKAATGLEAWLTRTDRELEEVEGKYVNSSDRKPYMAEIISVLERNLGMDEHAILSVDEREAAELKELMDQMGIKYRDWFEKTFNADFRNEATVSKEKIMKGIAESSEFSNVEKRILVATRRVFALAMQEEAFKSAREQGISIMSKGSLKVISQRTSRDDESAR